VHSLIYLASLLEAQGDLAGARPLSERALAISGSTLHAKFKQQRRGLTGIFEVGAADLF
jgi:hypothetical protein